MTLSPARHDDRSAYKGLREMESKRFTSLINPQRDAHGEAQSADGRGYPPITHRTRASSHDPADGVSHSLHLSIRLSIYLSIIMLELSIYLAVTMNSRR